MLLHFYIIFITYLRLTKGRATFFRPETIVASFLASYGVTFQSVIKSYFKTPVFGAPLSYNVLVFELIWNIILILGLPSFYNWANIIFLIVFYRTNFSSTTKNSSLWINIFYIVAPYVINHLSKIEILRYKPHMTSNGHLELIVIEGLSPLSACGTWDYRWNVLRRSLSKRS